MSDEREFPTAEQINAVLVLEGIAWARVEPTTPSQHAEDAYQIMLPGVMASSHLDHAYPGPLTYVLEYIACDSWEGRRTGYRTPLGPWRKVVAQIALNVRNMHNGLALHIVDKPAAARPAVDVRRITPPVEPVPPEPEDDRCEGSRPDESNPGAGWELYFPSLAAFAQDAEERAATLGYPDADTGITLQTLTDFARDLTVMIRQWKVRTPPPA